MTAHLRPLVQGDAPAVLAAFRGDPTMTRQGRVEDLADARAYVERVTDAAAPSVFALLSDDVVVGVVGVRPIDPDNRLGWFWYWTHREHRGRGLTADAAASVADWALGARGLHRLELGHRADNPASGGVARAAGFVPEGREREKFLVDGRRVDVLTYARLSTDPEPRRTRLPVEESPVRAPGPPATR